MSNDDSLSSSTQADLSASGLTIPSDSEPYSSLSPPTSSPSPPNSQNNNHTSSSRPVIIYEPPTFWSLMRGAAINLLLPFVNGMMLGFGELLAHEAAFRLGWGGTNVWPRHRHDSSTLNRHVGPGVEMREDPVEKRRRRGEMDPDLQDMASLE